MPIVEWNDITYVHVLYILCKYIIAELHYNDISYYSIVLVHITSAYKCYID